MAVVSRRYVFTLNNYDEEDVEFMKEIYEPTHERCPLQFLMFALETGDGTPHVQGYLELKQGMRKGRRYIKQMLGTDRVSVRIALGTEAENRIYFHKEKERDGWEFFECGTPITQGKRTDFESIRNHLNDGVTIRRMLREATGGVLGALIRYSRGINILRAALVDDRTFRTKGIWLYGPTGGGKTYAARKMAEGHTMYCKASEHKWWDYYDGEEYVIIDDIRGGIAYETLLHLCDTLPFLVETKGYDPHGP